MVSPRWRARDVVSNRLALGVVDLLSPPGVDVGEVGCWEERVTGIAPDQERITPALLSNIGNLVQKEMSQKRGIARSLCISV